MIPKSGYRFSEKIMLKKPTALCLFGGACCAACRRPALSNKPRSDYTFQSKASTGTDADPPFHNHQGCDRALRRTLHG
jgi:hypothetical protein